MAASASGFSVSGASVSGSKLVLGALAVAALACSTPPARANFVTIIDPANPTFTQALGINSANTIVGYGNATDFDGFQLTLPPVAGNFTRENFPNPTPPPTTLFTQVVGIDAAGNSVGFYVSNPAVGTTSGFFKAGAGGFTPINQPGFVFNQLLGINQGGSLAAGYSSTDPAGMTGQQAFLTNGLVFSNINAMLPPNLNSQATGVNNVGETVGFYQYDAAGDFSAFTDKGGVIASFQFPGSVSTQALGVNDLGDIVGDYILGGQMFGFIDKGGVFASFEAPGATATTINGINDLGNYVGFYTAASGNTNGFFVNPAPEPASLLLLAGGLLGMGAFARRRKTG